jgi:hypothetical protein
VPNGREPDDDLIRERDFTTRRFQIVVYVGLAIVAVLMLLWGLGKFR